MEKDDKIRDCNQLALGDYSPEKAGVGGSIPSLATIFSTTYKPLIPQLRSKTFQLVTAQLLVRAAFPPHVSATRGCPERKCPSS